jgi:hypothetical protein
MKAADLNPTRATAYERREAEFLQVLMQMLVNALDLQSDEFSMDKRYEDAIQLLIDEGMVTLLATGLFRLEWEALEKKRAAAGLGQARQASAL